ncbi:MAG: bifunctional serine/threonine-protein kinase/formylglycine-generating enzyme family protein [Planctomycetota bacterium]
MTPERWERLQRLFAHASQLAPEEQRPYLERECGDDPQLLAEALELLRERPPTDFVEPPPPHAPGDLFGVGLEGRRLGDFLLEHELGRGGMGVVYRARQMGLDRTVAIKILPQVRQRGDALARFERESQAASALSHPSIVPILASGIGDGSAWYAMRLVEGHDLSQELRNQSGAGAGPVLLSRFESPEYIREVSSLIQQLAGALEAAHRAGVVHRDVKPANILLDQAGHAYLTDFGLARDERFGSLTATGDVRGTPSYMSPEQAGLAKIRIDHRTDVYSLSVVLYEALSLRVPHTGQTAAEVLSRIASQEAPSLRSISSRIPTDLAVICGKGMSREPRDRYATAAELGEDLGRFLRHESIHAQPPPLSRRAARFLKRRRVEAGVAAGLLVAGLASFGVAQAHEKGRQRDELRSAVGRVMQVDDWTAATQELASARALALVALEDGSIDELGLAGDLQPFFERLASFRDETLAEAERLLGIGLGRQELESYRGEPLLAPIRSQETNLALLHLARLSHIFADDDEIQRAADPERIFPRVSVNAVLAGTDTAHEGPGAEVRWRAIDPFGDRPGEPQVLGTLPLVGHPVPPGHGRIEVTAPGFGTTSLTRHLAVGLSYDLTAQLAPRPLAYGDMVRIEGGTLELGPDRTIGCLLVADATPVAPFYLDEAEVSNGDFLEFLEATGRTAPRQWRDAGYANDPSDLPIDDVARWLTLPAVNVSWFDARDYAEWRGKRLPTHTELEWAFAGADAAPGSGAYPGQANLDGRPSSDFPNPSDREGYAIYYANVVPVRDPAYRQPPHGLFHAHGNVDELTESFFVEIVEGRLTTYSSTLLKYGSYWASKRERLGLDTHGPIGAGPEYRRIQTGFRCALDAPDS